MSIAIDYANLHNQVQLVSVILTTHNIKILQRKEPGKPYENTAACISFFILILLII